MNSFGKNFRVQIFGESHGPAVGIIIDGCPAGLRIVPADFLNDLERRKGGLQKGTTSRQEDDLPVFLSGIFDGKTTGSPLTIMFENKNVRSSDYEGQKNTPRPGHADFVAHEKFGGNEDYRGGGHFSGRLTVCLVAAGVIAKKILTTNHNDDPVLCKASILEIGGDSNLQRALDSAIAEQDSIGGIIECLVTNLPVGLGEPFFDSVESLISHAVFSIPAIKGIEFGAGFAAAKMTGSRHNDSLQEKTGKTFTNNSGGISGGLTNGNDLLFRVVVKPTSSTPAPQQTLNLETGSVENLKVKGRHDLCIALRVPPVLEAATLCVIADLLISEQHISRVYEGIQ